MNPIMPPTKVNSLQDVLHAFEDLIRKLNMRLEQLERKIGATSAETKEEE